MKLTDQLRKMVEDGFEMQAKEIEKGNTTRPVAFLLGRDEKTDQQFLAELPQYSTSPDKKDFSKKLLKQAALDMNADAVVVIVESSFNTFSSEAEREEIAKIGNIRTLPDKQEMLIASVYLPDGTIFMLTGEIKRGKEIKVESPRWIDQEGGRVKSFRSPGGWAN